MQEQLYKHFWSKGHKSFLNEALNTLIDKTDRNKKKLKKKTNMLNGNIENKGNIWP